MKTEILSRLAVLNRNLYGKSFNGIKRPGGRVLEMERLNRARKELTNQFRTTMLTMLGGAFAFVMALFWNDAIKETIAMIVPANQALLYKYLAAMLVTCIGVMALFVMAKVLKSE